MLRVLPTAAPLTAQASRAAPAKVLVFTIQQELFETEFKSRSPIDRAVLQRYLEKLVEVYPAVKVLAIDYDLSPNDDDPAAQQVQAAFDAFLSSLVQAGKRVVLITHLPVANRKLCELKTAWEQEQYDKGILFGGSELLHYRLFGTVVKYAEREDSFPAAVRAAAHDGRVTRPRFTCDDPQPSSRESFAHKGYRPINFGQAVGPVRRCELYKLSGFEQCKYLLSQGTEAAEVLFFGGHYGRDDTFMTPLGDTPGVAIQAYTYYSLVQPLHQKHWQAWMIDVGMGVVAGFIFEGIWHGFHRARREAILARQLALALGNFVTLLGILVAVVAQFASWLIRGIWINPGPMFIGLYIHSYLATATATDQGGRHGPHTVHGLAFLLKQFAGIPGPQITGWDRRLHWLFKVAVFWITGLMAVYLLLAHH